MNKGLAVVLGVAGVGALAAVAYASSEHDHPPLPLPPNKCASASDVGQATTEVMAQPDVTPQHLRDAAAVLRDWEKNGNTFCDAQAKAAAQTSIVLLEGKATALEQGQPHTNPSGQPQSPINFDPNILQVLQVPPPGYVSAKKATGLHGESGTVYLYYGGDEWFVPDDPGLVPYYVPGGSSDIHTTGACCAACERGEECTGCS